MSAPCLLRLSLALSFSAFVPRLARLWCAFGACVADLHFSGFISSSMDKSAAGWTRSADLRLGHISARPFFGISGIVGVLLGSQLLM